MGLRGATSARMRPRMTQRNTPPPQRTVNQNRTPATPAAPATPPVQGAQGAPRTPPAPATPPARDNQGGGGLFGGFRLPDSARNLIRDLVPGPNITPERRQALEYVRGMLEPNRLGGADRTFNFADRQAIMQSLLRDTPGLSQAVQAQLRGEGKHFQANLVERALNGARGPLVNAARNRVYSEAPGQIMGQLTQGLNRAGIDPNTGGTPDTTRRNLTFDQLRTFEGHAATLQQMQQEVADRLGMNITFPNGISQEAIDFTLRGGMGFPPGAVVTPRGR